MGSAIRATIKQKKTLPLDFLNRFYRSFFRFSLPADSSLRFRLLNRIFVSLWLSGAIRSVSHLVLAQVGWIGSLPPNLNRRERAGTGIIAGSVSAPSGSVFLRQAIP